MFKHRDIWTLTAALTICAVARAGGDPPEDTRRIAPPKRLQVFEAQPLQPLGKTVNIASVPQVVRRAVARDAARRFKVDESAVVLVEAESLTWGDGSLGCPQPGMAYTQALVPGYRVTAKTASGLMRYHTDDRGNVTTCAPASPRASIPAHSTRAPDR